MQEMYIEINFGQNLKLGMYGSSWIHDATDAWEQWYIGF